MIHYGDCLDVMAGMESDSVDLIVTSPPYADARKHTYGGVAPEDYVDWFLPRAEQIKRIMKPTGSFVLNIKEKCEDGERHLYVLKLIISLREEVGFRWVEEYIWHKKTAMPGKWKYRFRDAWERLLHFTKTQDFKMRQEEVMEDVADIILKQLASGIKNKEKRRTSGTGANFGTRLESWRNRDKIYPSNVLYICPIQRNKGHSAVFPDPLPEFFIKLFTDEGDVVLDPFLGSGTTYKVAQKMNRIAIGIEILEDYSHLHQPDPQMMLL